MGVRHAADEGARFQFGANWKQFLETVDEARIEQSTRDLAGMLSHTELDGARFLDIGSGSGLSSLAARRLGAEVHSFDYDVESVECSRELRRRFAADDPAWTVEPGSALDRAYLAKLGNFDVVYSWGVLHHTGAMWDGLENVVDVVAPGGTLFIAIYNDQGRRSRFWRAVKQRYARGPSAVRPPLLLLPLAVFWLPKLLLDAARGHPLRSWRSYGATRGMSAWHDVVDWTGGYPFEVATPGQIHDFYRSRGFTLTKLVTTVGTGCNEFVFVRDSLSSG